ncbi:hypothetical protein RRG08_027164 [Elysia crispata]|uniref:Uncharacterized protein n=1 Tax=Elysia crispata TaxID=231223 RepID=A0AAE1B4S8_9GAST|nr:hypothetical protein RRG08_027164 [Elysia crispata]
MELRRSTGSASSSKVFANIQRSLQESQWNSSGLKPIQNDFHLGKLEYKMDNVRASRVQCLRGDDYHSRTDYVDCPLSLPILMDSLTGLGQWCYTHTYKGVVYSPGLR